MTRAELAKIGRALFGPRWQTPVAACLGVSDRTVRRWAAGGAVPHDAAETLRALKIAARPLAV